MKKILRLFSLVMISVFFVGIITVNAEEKVYKDYVIGEKITAKIDDKGHTGNFIVIENSDTTSDEVVVIQANHGLDDVIKASNIRYDSNHDFKIDDNDAYMTDLEVTNVEVRTYLAYGSNNYTSIDRFITQAPGLFNGYIRTINKKFGVMTVGTDDSDYNYLVNKYGQDAVNKVFKGQNYWLSDGLPSSTVPQFVETESYHYEFAPAENSLKIYNSSNVNTQNISFPKYARVLDAQLATTALTGTNLTTKYEPAIMFTLCKQYIVTPDTVNPDTADMNIIIMAIVGVLAIEMVILSTRKIFLK